MVNSIINEKIGIEIHYGTIYGNDVDKVIESLDFNKYFRVIPNE